MIIKNNKVYDTLKYVTQVFLPAAGALYFGLAGYWNLPNADSVVGSVVVVDTFLGLLLAGNQAAYNNSDEKYDGSIDAENVAEGVKRYSLSLKGDPAEIENMKQVVFKVNPAPPEGE